MNDFLNIKFEIDETEDLDKTIKQISQLNTKPKLSDIKCQYCKDEKKVLDRQQMINCTNGKQKLKACPLCNYDMCFKCNGVGTINVTMQNPYYSKQLFTVICSKCNPINYCSRCKGTGEVFVVGIVKSIKCISCICNDCDGFKVCRKRNGKFKKCNTCSQDLQRCDLKTIVSKLNYNK